MSDLIRSFEAREAELKGLLAVSAQENRRLQDCLRSAETLSELRLEELLLLKCGLEAGVLEACRKAGRTLEGKEGSAKDLVRAAAELLAFSDRHAIITPALTSLHHFELRKQLARALADFAGAEAVVADSPKTAEPVNINASTGDSPPRPRDIVLREAVKRVLTLHRRDARGRWSPGKSVDLDFLGYAFDTLFGAMRQGEDSNAGN